MKHILNTNPLEEYGINILTGEACAYGMRLLCDLNSEGAALISNYFSIQPEGLFPNWNSTVNGQPAIASIMLPREIFPSLIRFALFREGYPYVIGSENSWAYTGFNGRDIAKNPLLASYIDGTADAIQSGKLRLYRNWKSPAQPSVGSRNVHAFTGRAE